MSQFPLRANVGPGGGGSLKTNITSADFNLLIRFSPALPSRVSDNAGNRLMYFKGLVLLSLAESATTPGTDQCTFKV